MNSTINRRYLEAIQSKVAFPFKSTTRNSHTVWAIEDWFIVPFQVRLSVLRVQSHGGELIVGRKSEEMCYFDLIKYGLCGHHVYRRCSYCHFARNDPYHACFGVKVLKRVWNQDNTSCEDCAPKSDGGSKQQEQQQRTHALSGVATARQP